jgi:arylsulfatase A-like enzyme
MSLYYGLVTEVDTWVGRIMEALRASGQAENTLVVFTSDHGEMLGEHARVSKSVFYEGAIRVPLLMWFPGRIPRRTRIDAAATGADIAPTILDYAGFQVPRNMHGRSLRRLIEGGGAEPGLAYCELGADPAGRNAQRIIRTREWKLAYYSGQPYLYDLAGDRHETKNLLAPEHRTAGAVEQGRRMKQRLLAHLEELGSPETSVIRSFRV